MIAIIHMPRTGGTSMLHYLKEALGEERVCRFPGPWNTQRVWKFREIEEGGDDVAVGIGHMSYCEYYAGHDWVTILRDPFERLISHFRFWRKKEGESRSLSHLISSGQFADHPFFLNESPPNMMTHMLSCGGGFFMAVRNLKRLSMILATDYLDLDLLRFSMRFDLPPPTKDYRMNHTTARRKRREDFPGEIVDWFDSVNCCDNELWRLGRQLSLNQRRKT